MNLLSNPLVVRMGLVLVVVAVTFAITVLIMRRMRRSLSDEAGFNTNVTPSDGSPLYAVIQQLKQQKHEIQAAQQAERRRAKTSENISAAILSHLSSGVMFITPDGLVRQANAAARTILGFASPVGLTTGQIFRDAAELASSGEPGARVADTIQLGLRQKIQKFEVAYESPAGEQRTLEITVTAVHSPGGDVLGTACLINDLTEVVQIRRQEHLRSEVSSEMALELHKSVQAIASYARRLQTGTDVELARQLAADVVDEAAHLEHTIGGFLSGARTARAASLS